MDTGSRKSKKSPKREGMESNDEPSGSGSYSSVIEFCKEKRMKKDDSGINMVPESEGSDCSDSGDNTYSGNKSSDTAVHNQSADSGNLESSSHDYDNVLNFEEMMDTASAGGKHFRTEMLSELSRSSDEDFLENKEDDPHCSCKYDPTPVTPLPKYKWNVTSAILLREYGFSSKYSPDLFRYNSYSSLHMVERLELMYKMNNHDGCVNALNFNASGTRLVSGSDDLRVVVWDWIVSKPVSTYLSGHSANVFQAKYIPFSNDSMIATCARDGQVRLGNLSYDGVSIGTKKLVQHKGSAHRLSLQLDSPNQILTCGEDAAVFSIDLREEKHENKIVICKSKGKKVPLYSIYINPFKPTEFVVSGRCPIVKIFDTRFCSNQSEGFVKEFCPDHLVADSKMNVTSVVYNYNGQEILASYNDEDIYIFDNNETDSKKFVHRYRGHRNYQTVKGVNYFGPKSEFIMSGSDCGNIFFWEKESEHIVKYMYGDEGGTVNCLEPHPTMPVLATSGLDNDIKIWVPSCEDPPDLSGLKNIIIQNMKGREEDKDRVHPDDFVDQTIWLLMQHLSRARRMPHDGSDDESASSTASSDEVDDSGVSVAECNQS